jgi:hypothetical protein
MYYMFVSDFLVKSCDRYLNLEPGGAVPDTCLELLYLQPSAFADAPPKGSLG